jgi:arylformamidase
MPLIDISVPLAPRLPGFPGDPPIVLERAGVPGAPFRISHLQLGSHAGTHIDAPAHLLPQGATVDAIPLTTLVGPCRVLDLRGHSGPIPAEQLPETQLTGVERLLLHTDNSALWDQPDLNPDYRGLTAAAAARLVVAGIKLIGIDYLSIEPFAGQGETHRILLEAGVVILEGLDLRQAVAGDYELLCLPLRLPGLDGAPCRAVLRPLSC